MKLIPKRNTVVIKLDAPSAVSEGGIVIPQSSQDNPTIGTVVSVGPGEFKDGAYVPIGLAEGDRVLFKAWEPVEIDVGGEKLRLMSVECILAVLLDEED